MNTTHYGLLDSSHSLFLLCRHSVGMRDQRNEVFAGYSAVHRLEKI